MDLPHPLLALESLGIPSNVTIAVLVMVASALFGGKIVRWSISLVSKKFASLSEEAKAGWSAVFHFPGVLFVTVITLFDPFYAIPSSFLFFFVLPMGIVKLFEERGPPTTRNVLLGPPRGHDIKTKKENRSEVKAKVKKEVEKKKKKDKEGRKIKIKEKLKKKILGLTGKSKVKMKIEEIKVGEGETKEHKKVQKAREPKKEIKVEETDIAKLKARQITNDVEILRRTLAEIESKYVGMHVEPEREPEPAKPEERKVDAVMKDIEAEVARRARTHRFVTWKEARELKEKTREVLENRRAEIEKRIGRGEDIRQIAEEIYMQVSKEEPSEAHRRHRRPKEEKKEKITAPPAVEEIRKKIEEKPKKKEEKEESEEDLLALLEKEGGEEASQESEEIEELEKLLKEI